MARLVGVDENYSLPPVVLDKLDEDYVSAIVVKGQDIDADGGEDSTGGVQDRLAAASTFGINRLHFPTGRYVIDSISITSSVKITTDPDTFFVRKAGADAASGSYWSAGAAMFEIDAPGLTVDISGSFTYDGNNTNQTSVEPTGFFLKAYPTSNITSDQTTVRITGGRFINGTSGYLCLRGDDVQRRYETHVTTYDCSFEATVYGKGRDDPSTPTALGYHPTYVHIFDYVTFVGYNFSATFDKETSTGVYAPCAINGTFYGSDYTQSGNASVLLYGRTYLRGMGRAARAWNNDNEFLTNNGIGAIDMYGNADELYIQHLTAVDCENVPARAKASLKRYTVEAAVLTNCHRGLQVGPSSTGPAETAVRISNVYSYGGTNPQVEVTGTTTTQRIPNVSVEGVYLAGPMTMPEDNVGEGAVHLRNLWNADVSSIEIHGAPWRGITARDVDHLELKGVDIDGAGQQGIHVTGGSDVSIEGYNVQNTAAEGVVVAEVVGHIRLGRGFTKNTVNYGTYQNSASATYTTMESLHAEAVTGTGRGYYVRGGDVLVSRCSIGTGVTVANAIAYHASVRAREENNSWNPTVRWGSAYITTIGTAQRGDQVWNPTPSAGGPAGWACVVAGSPGTWVPLNLAAA